MKSIINLACLAAACAGAVLLTSSAAADPAQCANGFNITNLQNGMVCQTPVIRCTPRGYYGMTQTSPVPERPYAIVGPDKWMVFGYACVYGTDVVSSPNQLACATGFARAYSEFTTYGTRFARLACGALTKCPSRPAMVFNAQAEVVPVPGSDLDIGFKYTCSYQVDNIKAPPAVQNPYKPIPPEQKIRTPAATGGR